MSDLPAALLNTPLLSQWIDFDTDDAVVVHTGKVEIGQGILTALAQVVADELDVDLARVRVPAATTARSPDEGYTAGSMSVEQTATVLRLVCAEIRTLFVDRAAALFGIPAADVEVDDGWFTSLGPRAGASPVESPTYWQLRGHIDLDRVASGMADPKRPDQWRLIGRSTSRLDLPAKMAGAVSFVHDLSFDAMLHGRVIRSSAPGARLVDCDEPAASTLPGVEAIVRQRHHLGVLAVREAIAVEAAERLRAACVWTMGAPTPDTRDLLTWLRTGDVSTRVIEERGVSTDANDTSWIRRAYTRPFLAHASLLPSCAIAQWNHGALEVWTHSQGIFALRDVIADVCGIDRTAVTVHHAEGAGCYGHNGADDVALDAVLLARAAPGRHVRVQWSREDELACAPFGPAMAIELAAKVSNGVVTTWHSDTWSNSHVMRPGYAGAGGLLAARELHPDQPPIDTDDPGGIARNAVPLYDFASTSVRTHTKLDMPVRTSSLRSLGAFANVFAIESFVDELAHRIGLDPLEMRLRHLSDERARSVLLEAARASRYGDACAADIGRGLAVARYKNVGGWCAVVAEVEARHDVQVRELTIAVDVGLVINPDGLINQIEGGAIQATSWTLCEEVRFAEGRVSTTTWETYPVLRFEQAPSVNVIIVSRPDEPPLGAGEIAQGPVAAAIANALFVAAGIRARDLPLTRSRLIELAMGSDNRGAEGRATT